MTKDEKKEDVLLLKDKDVQPTADVLDAVLGDRAEAYAKFLDRIADLGIALEWRYYNDSKAWLGKATHKKKTTFWLSVWKDYFQVGLFFTERTLPKTSLNEPAIGKLIPVVVKVRGEAELGELFELVEYKKNLK